MGYLRSFSLVFPSNLTSHIVFSLHGIPLSHDTCSIAFSEESPSSTNSMSTFPRPAEFPELSTVDGLECMFNEPQSHSYPVRHRTCLLAPSGRSGRPSVLNDNNNLAVPINIPYVLPSTDSVNVLGREIIMLIFLISHGDTQEDI